jgi:hypothetical protein
MDRTYVRAPTVFGDPGPPRPTHARQATNGRVRQTNGQAATWLSLLTLRRHSDSEVEARRKQRDTHRFGGRAPAGRGERKALRYRSERIRQLTGLDLARQEDRMRADFALRLLQVNQGGITEPGEGHPAR